MDNCDAAKPRFTKFENDQRLQPTYEFMKKND